MFAPLHIPLSKERALFNMFAPGIAYVAVENEKGEPGIGTCFHIGEFFFVTARHVVENCKITKIATTLGTTNIDFGSYVPTETYKIEGPFFHPNPNYDLAVLRLPEVNAPQIPFLPVAEEQFDHQLLLRTVIVLGYPPIPGSKSPVLLCARAEVNASFKTYFDNQRVYIVSCLARGGFSGGPALTEPHHCLGVVTKSMLKAPLPAELGFMAVVGPWPILELLNHHDIMPRYLREEMWNPAKKTKSN
jgi:Trypsin-like peptidase domain